MLTLTRAAGDYLKSVLERAKASEDTAIRIVLEDDELAPALDTERPGDETLDYHGKTVLLLDAEMCEYLADSTLDLQATDDGLRLLILQRGGQAINGLTMADELRPRLLRGRDDACRGIAL